MVEPSGGGVDPTSVPGMVMDDRVMGARDGTANDWTEMAGDVNGIVLRDTGREISEAGGGKRGHLTCRKRVKEQTVPKRM